MHRLTFIGLHKYSVSNSRYERNEALQQWQKLHEGQATLQRAMPCTVVTQQNEEHLGHSFTWNLTRELCMELNISFNALETKVAMLKYCKTHAR